MFAFSYDALTKEQKNAYLRRIGCEGLQEVSKQTLDTLVYQHQCTVPFEALDLILGAEDISLETEDLFQKIVVNRRGGFCFELNGMFVLLLRAMGFDAVSVVCRVVGGRDYLADLTHRATIVRLDGKQYICDVGMGGPMAPFAVELSSVHQTQHGETYWVDPTYEGWYLVKRLTSTGEESATTVFGLQPFLAKDFYLPCRGLIHKPESLFRKVRMVNLRTPDGYYNLRENVLSVTTHGEKMDITFTEEEFPGILQKYFGLQL